MARFVRVSNPRIPECVRHWDLTGAAIVRYNYLRESVRPRHSENDRFKRGKEKMKNVELFVEGNILTIKVDLTKEFGPSSSGKTIIIASTEGNISVPNRDEKIGLNVYRKKPVG